MKSLSIRHCNTVNMYEATVAVAGYCRAKIDEGGGNGKELTPEVIELMNGKKILVECAEIHGAPTFQVTSVKTLQ